MYYITVNVYLNEMTTGYTVSTLIMPAPAFLAPEEEKLVSTVYYYETSIWIHSKAKSELTNFVRILASYRMKLREQMVEGGFPVNDINAISSNAMSKLMESDVNVLSSSSANVQAPKAKDIKHMSFRESVNAKWKSSQKYAAGGLISGNNLYLSTLSENHDDSDSFANKSRFLPGVNSLVKYPCDCVVSKDTQTIRYMVIHLNDQHKWTREKIADWLDELHDSGQVNLEFQPWDTSEKEVTK